MLEFIILGLLFLLLITILLLVLFYTQGKPMIKYVLARMKKKPLALLIRDSGGAELVDIDVDQGMVKVPDAPKEWVFRYPAPISLYGVPMIILMDSMGVVVNHKLMLALQEYIKKYNEEHPDHQLSGPTSVFSALMNEPYGAEIKIPPLSPIPLIELRRYMMHIKPAEIEGKIQMVVNRRLAQFGSEAAMALMKYVIFGIIIIVVLAIIVIFFAK